MRASDADRDRVAERLREAATEGRILAHEFEERLAAALRARTYGELDAVVSDLPGTRVVKKRSRSYELARSHPVAAVAVVATISVAVLAVVAVVIASFLMAGSVWLILAVVLMARRGSHYGVRGSAGRRCRGIGQPSRTHSRPGSRL